LNVILDGTTAPAWSIVVSGTVEEQKNMDPNTAGIIHGFIISFGAGLIGMALGYRMRKDSEGTARKRHDS
jgi:hypothetical protein